LIAIQQKHSNIITKAPFTNDDVICSVSFILHIDTAVEGASICVSKGTEVLGLSQNKETRDSAAWLHTAIKDLLNITGVELKALAAVAVSSGPGSYTGLRVGMATAKGLCYALHIPFITIDTLQVMAAAAELEPTELLCPMIDARRMEVFTAIFDKTGNIVLPHQNLIVDEHSFQSLLQNHTITFFGNGSQKLQSVLTNTNALFKPIEYSAVHMTGLAWKLFSLKAFTDLAYSEPYYVKEFFTPHFTQSMQ
jgi:tRNA threonylcarbamoyladenosine biosynthesis protein TsaB